MEKYVLLIDNDRDFLETRKEWLEEAGYHALTAESLEEARAILRSRVVHLALVDVRMVDDDSPTDTTGLDFVREPEFAHIVKIILTGRHFVLSDVSDVMKRKSDPHALPDAVNYLEKDKGWQVMLDVIAQALEDYSGINWALDPEWPSPAFPEDLAGRLGDAPRVEWLGRGEELDNLLAMAFHDYERVRVDRLLWHNGQRLALAVTAQRGLEAHGRVFVIGLAQSNDPAAGPLRRVAPDRAPEGHAQLVEAPRPPRTLHYRAVLLRLPGARLDQVRTLRRFYVDSRHKVMGDCLRRLVTVGFRPSARDELVADAAHADNLLRAHAGLTDDSPEALRRRILEVGAAAEAQGLAALRLVDGKLVIRPRQGRDQETPDPAGWLARPGPADFERPLVVGENYGAAPPDTILVAADGRSWLTDHSHSGHGPLLSSLADMEAQVMHDLHPFPNLMQFVDAENQLLKAGDLAHHLEPLVPEMHKPFAAIQQIRTQAARYGGDVEAYYRALFYHTARRLLDMPADGPAHGPVGLAPLCACLGLGLLARRLPSVEPPPPPHPGLWIDEATERCWLDGVLLPSLAPKPYNFLLYLWRHPRQRCDNDAIMKAVIGSNHWDKNYPAQLVQLIRDALGPSARLYLVNRGSGYILYPDGRPDAQPST